LRRGDSFKKFNPKAFYTIEDVGFVEKGVLPQKQVGAFPSISKLFRLLTLCRLSDPDRSPKFNKAMKALGAEGIMGDLDDGPEQIPLDGYTVQCAINELLPSKKFDLIITHGFGGEYTRHRRHEEVGNAVTTLWENEKLFSKEVWRFAYEDGDGKYLPKAVKDADLKIRLPKEIWQKKYDIITKIYGFGPSSFEAKTTPRKEAFWCLKSDDKLQKP
jgi:hypothetical protein